MKGSATPVAAAGGEDEDLWVCKKCGWTYPNPHPSAKHRRNHRKQCGKVKGLQHKDVAPALQHEHEAGSSDNASSDDEDHHHRGTAHVEPVNIEEKPAVTEEPKTAVAEAQQQPVHDGNDSGLQVKDEFLENADNSLPDEKSAETREEIEKVSFDPRKEPIAGTGIQDDEPQLISNAEEPRSLLREEPQPDPKKEEPELVTQEEEPRAVPEPEAVSHNEEQQAAPKEPEDAEVVPATPDEPTTEPSVIHALETPHEPETVKEDKSIEAAAEPPANSDPRQQPESLKQDNLVAVPLAASDHSDSLREPESLKHDKAAEGAPVEALADSNSLQGGARSQDSWEQLLDAQLATPKQIVSDTSSSAANNDHLSSSAFPQSSFTDDKELSTPTNGNPFVAEPETPNTTNSFSVEASKHATDATPDKNDINLFDIKQTADAPVAADSGEASSSTSWKTKEGEGDIKPHIALKALFDEDPRPRQQQQPQQSSHSDEQETLIRSGSRRNSNVLQRVIETVKNSPAKFSSTGTGAAKKTEEVPPINNRSKSRWSSYICCSQVR